MKRALVVLSMVLLFGATVFAQATLTIYADDTRTPLMRQVGAAYTAATGVLVQVTEVANSDLRPQFITASQAGSGPDIVIGANDWLGELVADGLIEPIVLGSRASDFTTAAVSAFTYAGNLYAMPYASENIALIYDKDRIPVPPSTWAELLTIARALYDPAVPMYGLVFENTAGNFYQWFPFLSAGGGYVFGFDAQGKYNPCDVGLANDGAVAGARLYQSMVQEGLIPVGVNGDTQNALIAAKSVAMVISGPWTLDAVRNAGWNYGIARIPTIDGNQPKVFAGYQGFYISSLSKNKTIASDFLLNYIATKDVMAQLEVIGSRPTAFIPAATLSSPDLLGFGAQGAFSVPMPFIPEMGSVWGAAGNALDLINSGTDPVSALQAAKKAILKAVGCQ